jgi:glucokinase
VILAGDVGATHTRLGLFECRDGRPTRVTGAKFHNRQHGGLDSVLDAFLDGTVVVSAACFGVAGPVLDGKCNITNVGWDLEVARLEERLADARVNLINDVEATAYGLALLDTSDLLVLNTGPSNQDAPAALIAAGTGLGESLLYPIDGMRRPIPAEAGHTDFAPGSSLECEFLEALRPRFGHVSWDRVLSGPGLQLIYEFLRDGGRYPERSEVASRIATEDPAAVITEYALANTCKLCSASLHMFVSVFGAEAGNLALRALARGGIYVGGGIAPKIIRKLTDGTFMRAFTAKGRMSSLMATIPVYVVLNDETGVLGAARYAALK